jgi:hypothetical protein
MQKKCRAIGMPSNRGRAASAESIQSAMAVCKKTGIGLAVSDNSQDPEKEKELGPTMAEAGLDYIKSPPCGMTENWMRAFNAADGEFVLMMGDDDSMFSVSPPPDFSKLPGDVVGIKPCLFAYTDGAGIGRVNFAAIQSPAAHDRIVENIKAANGTNLGIFSFWRRDILKSIMDLLFIHHPTKGTYCDWAVMNALVSSGKVVTDPSLCYFYNLQNWAGTQEHIQAQVERAFTSCGLPAGSSAYALLLNAIDSFIFVNRKDSPLPEQERGLTAIFSLNIYLQGYTKNIPADSKHAHAGEIKKLSQKLVGNDSVPEIFSLFSEIFDAIRPNLGEQYREFYQEAVGKPWGVL